MNAPALQYDGLSVVIAVDNDEATLPCTVSGLLDYLPGIVPAFELLLIGDASTDKSVEIMSSFAASHTQVRHLTSAFPKGRDAALLYGIRAARHPVTLTFNADGTHPREAIPLLLEKLSAGVDLVIGYTPPAHYPGFRDAAQASLRLWLSRFGMLPGCAGGNGMRVIRTALRENFAHISPLFVSFDATLNDAAAPCVTVPVAYRHTPVCKSPYQWSEFYMILSNAFTSHSLNPVRFIQKLAFVLIAAGVVAAIFSREMKWWYTGVFGGLTGLCILSISIVGEYAARHYLLALDRKAADTGHEATPGTDA